MLLSPKDLFELKSSRDSFLFTHLSRPFIEKGGKLIGKWSIEGYEFDESVAQEGDKFLGLALDYDNQDELSEERITKWTDSIQSEFN